MSTESQRMIRAICFSFAIMLCDDNLFEGEWRIYAVMALWVVILSDFEHKKVEK